MPVLELRTPEAFERDVIGSDELTVVTFWASWCPFCRMFRPMLEAAAADNLRRFAFVHIDEDENPLWERYNVKVVPSMALFRRGDLLARLDGRLGRGISREELRAFLDDVSSVASA